MRAALRGGNFDYDCIFDTDLQEESLHILERQGGSMPAPITSSQVQIEKCGSCGPERFGTFNDLQMKRVAMLIWPPVHTVTCLSWSSPMYLRFIWVHGDQCVVCQGERAPTVRGQIPNPSPSHC